ncbi:MAG: uroporphyrinogen-III synthase [Magnetococcales bacterium]|nr:uroporphyrinogen-III synthase [Magnetococcales bacterium]
MPDPSQNLAGRRLLITRPLPEAHDTALLAQRHGAQTILQPLLEAQPPDDPEPFRQAMANLSHYDGIVFTSIQAVRAFLQFPAPSPKSPKIYAVGHKTAALLAQGGYHPIVPAHPMGGQELALEILRTSQPNHRLLFPQVQEGREELTTILHQHARHIDRVVCYHMAPVRQLETVTIERLQERRIDAIPFFSGRTAQIFLNLLPQGDPFALLEKPMLAALSTTTADVMRSLGLRVDLVSHQPTAEAMIATLAQALQSVTITTSRS